MHVLISDLREGEAFEPIPGEPLPNHWDTSPTVVIGDIYTYAVAFAATGGQLPPGWSWVSRHVTTYYTKFLVNVISRWDGWVDPVRFAQALTAAANPRLFVNPVPIGGAFDDYVYQVRDKYRVIHWPRPKFPHTCNLCGAPALEVFFSVECSKSCVPGRKPK